MPVPHVTLLLFEHYPIPAVPASPIIPKSIPAASPVTIHVYHVLLPYRQAVPPVLALLIDNLSVTQHVNVPWDFTKILHVLLV